MARYKEPHEAAKVQNKLRFAKRLAKAKGVLLDQKKAIYLIKFNAEKADLLKFYFASTFSMKGNEFGVT